jgi:hypothetical protein
LSSERAARRSLVIGIAAATLAIGKACAAQNAAGSSTCEIRVFQAGTLNSTSPSALQGGLIPAAIEGAREEKFPTSTVESQMNLALSREAVLDIVKTMPWLRFLDASQVDVGPEKDNLSKSDIRARVDSGKRNTSTSRACYLELYASQQVPPLQPLYADRFQRPNAECHPRHRLVAVEWIPSARRRLNSSFSTGFTAEFH